MLNKKYPIILITIMLCSYLAPLLDNESLEETKVVQEKIDTLFKRHYIFDMAEYDCFIFLVIQVNDYFSINSM